MTSTSIEEATSQGSELETIMVTRTNALGQLSDQCWQLSQISKFVLKSNFFTSIVSLNCYFVVEDLETDLSLKFKFMYKGYLVVDHFRVKMR